MKPANRMKPYLLLVLNEDGEIVSHEEYYSMTDLEWDLEDFLYSKKQKGKYRVYWQSRDEIEVKDETE